MPVCQISRERAGHFFASAGPTPILLCIRKSTTRSFLPMDASLLEIICCPETHQPLRFATTDELARMTPSSSSATPSSSTPLEAALLREDGRAAYPIREGIPLLVIEAQLTIS